MAVVKPWRTTDDGSGIAHETARMPGVLVIYASTHGHTAKIAGRVARSLRRRGLSVDLREVAGAADLSPAEFDGVVIGASVHGGHHQHELVEWTKRHARGLNGMPSAFFSVSLTAADDTEESRRATRGYIDDFLDDTGLIPAQAVSFAGALQYREYDFMTRLVMRVLMRRGEHPTDIAHDYDYTDWDSVDRFAREFEQTLASP